jgi:hypothetical protein
MGHADLEDGTISRADAPVAGDILEARIAGLAPLVDAVQGPK